MLALCQHGHPSAVVLTRILRELAAEAIHHQVVHLVGAQGQVHQDAADFVCRAGGVGGPLGGGGAGEGGPRGCPLGRGPAPVVRGLRRGRPAAPATIPCANFPPRLAGMPDRGVYECVRYPAGCRTFVFVCGIPWRKSVPWCFLRLKCRYALAREKICTIFAASSK